MTYQKLYEKMQECGLISGTWGHHLKFLASLISDENKGKEELLKLFLLYFALIDDGNVYMPLDRDELTEKVNEKIDGLEVLIEEEADKKGKELPDEGVDSAKPAEVTEKLNRMEEVRAGFSGACDALSEIEGLDFVADSSLFCVKDNRLFTKKFFEDVEEIISSATRLFVSHTEEKSRFNYHDYKKSDFILTDGQEKILNKGVYNNLLVTGGPGTGKTASIFFLLCALLDADPEKYNVYLAAPSGKAAARMKESVQREIGDLTASPRARAKIASLQEYTIHRLLETDLNNNGFVHNRKNPFPKNSVFVIDEASMIDVDLFAALLQAIPDEARVFILGDKDQLPSVECGAVFAELLEFVSDDNKVSLTESRRFSASSEIFQLAQAVNNGDILPVTDADWVPAAKFDIALLNPKRENPIYYYKDDPCGSKEMESISEKWYDAFYKDLPGLCSGLDSENEEVLEQISGILDSARILSANNEGVRGVNTINRTILKKKFAGKTRYSGFYPGELVMVIRNNKPLNLYNGDSGVAVTVPDADGKPVMYLMFKKETSLQLEDGKKDNRIFKRNGYIFYPAVLVNREDVVTAFAITIHKSQGSDYGNILVILPKRKGHPLLNRQIVYTAITRTKGTTYIVSNQENLEQAKKTVVKRNTGVIKEKKQRRMNYTMTMNQIFECLEMVANNAPMGGGYYTNSEIECAESFKNIVSNCYDHRKFTDTAVFPWENNGDNEEEDYPFCRKLKYENRKGHCYRISVYAEMGPHSATGNGRIRICLDIDERSATSRDKGDFIENSKKVMQSYGNFILIGKRTNRAIGMPEQVYIRQNRVVDCSGNCVDYGCVSILINQDTNFTDSKYQQRIRRAIKNLEMYYLDLFPSVIMYPGRSIMPQNMRIFGNLINNIAPKVLQEIVQKTSGSDHLYNILTLELSDDLVELFPVNKEFCELKEELENEIAELADIDVDQRRVEEVTCECVPKLLYLLNELKVKIDGLERIRDIEQAKEIRRLTIKVLEWINNDCIEFFKEVLGEIIAKVKETVNEIQHKVTFRAGEYSHQNKTITLFNKITENDDGMEKTFAHELFHAYHYEKCSDVVWCGESQVKSIVLESLADYFAKRYCESQNITQNLLQKWQRNDMYEYPYSGAQYIPDDDSFRQIFNETRRSVNFAFETIIKLKTNGEGNPFLF